MESSVPVVFERAAWVADFIWFGVEAVVSLCCRHGGLSVLHPGVMIDWGRRGGFFFFTRRGPPSSRGLPGIDVSDRLAERIENFLWFECTIRVLVEELFHFSGEFFVDKTLSMGSQTAHSRFLSLCERISHICILAQMVCFLED